MAPLKIVVALQRIAASHGFDFALPGARSKTANELDLYAPADPLRTAATRPSRQEPGHPLARGIYDAVDLPEERLPPEASLAAVRVAAETGEDHGASRLIKRYLSSAPPDEAKAYLDELGRVLLTRPKAAEILAGFLAESTRVYEPAPYLRDVAALSLVQGLSSESLAILGEKASTGQVDPKWLLTSGLTPEMIDHMGGDLHTAWWGLRRAAELPTRARELWAARALRGIAGELVARRFLPLYFGRYHVSARQLVLGDRRRPDFLLSAGEGWLEHPVEVKNWLEETWKDCLARVENLDDPNAESWDHLIEQLRSFQHPDLGPPILAVTEVPEPLFSRIEDAVAREVPEIEVIALPAAEVENVLAELRAALFPAKGNPPLKR